MVALCKPGKETLEETKPAGTWILEFQPPEIRENKFLFFKPRAFFIKASLWYFVIVPLANQDRFW